ncbi:MAG: MoaD/ThiS family protein [Acidobacteria bacterium]|nr:MoaD/ThiS family protein [Acidobacteriota bacterium]
MPVAIRIPTPLRHFSGGNGKVSVEGSTGIVLDALERLWELHPALRDRIVNEQGQVREHINIFVGEENIRFTGGLATPVSDGSEILIFPAVSGG